jgi:trans-aconitate 2-methyltransferase
MKKPKESYVWNAADYAKNSANQYTWAKELIPKLQLSGNDTLLDIGCGDGKITAEIAKCLPNGRVVGIDTSADMINLAKRTFPIKDYPNLAFKVMDARKLTFQGEFDRMFSNAALHGVQRSLKQGGRVLFQMAGKGNAQAVLCLFDELMVLPRWRRYFEGFTFPYAFLDPQEYRQLLMQAGLKPVRVELFPRDMKFPGAEGMAGWVRTTWLPFTERIPVEQRGEMVQEIVNRYLASHPTDAEGVVHLGMVRLEVEACKL